MSSQEARRIVVIDGNSQMHRAFHALPKSMRSTTGQPTNAVYGFFTMLMKMIDTLEPDAIICAFDKGKPQARIDKLDSYKANRPPTDPDLKSQFPIAKELLVALNIPIIELEGWEGDDILGTLGRLGEEAGHEMLLATGDHDAYQLATDSVHIVTTKKGFSEVAVVDPEEVKNRDNLPPKLIPDYYGLKGDSSDNIPGVPGIGPKRAQELLLKYGDLEGVIDHADEVKGKMGENLRAHIEDALISRDVARIITTAPVDIDFNEVQFPSFSEEEMREAFTKYDFNTLMTRLSNYANLSDDHFVSDTFVLEPFLTGNDAIQFLDSELKKNEFLAVHVGESFEGGGLFSENDLLVVASKNGVASIYGKDQVIEALAKLFTTKHAILVAQDIKALSEIILPADLSKNALISTNDIPSDKIFDVSVAAYLLDSSRRSFEIEQLAIDFLGEISPTVEQFKEVVNEDVTKAHCTAVTLSALAEKLDHALKADNSDRCFYEIEMPLIPVLIEIERNGMPLDVDRLEVLSKKLEDDIEEISQDIFDISGETFNIASPKQLGHVLFEVMGLPIQRKTKTGYSTDAQVLENLREYSPIADKIIEYRERTKLKNTYIDAFPKQLKGDGRIHTTLNQTVAATGRLSSSNPNLQNIPVRTELGRTIRDAFAVPNDRLFVTADYSQIELRLLAHLSEDQGLIDAFKHGDDFHAETAARVFNVDVDEVDTNLRSRAKAVNFGIIYGQQAYGLSTSLGVSYEEAQHMIDRYYEEYPDVRIYLDEVIEFAREHEWVETFYGRKRHVPDINSSNQSRRSFGERTAMNHPMQGGAADIIKIAMINVQKRLASEQFESLLIGQVHDELDFEAPKDEFDDLKKMVAEEMESVVELKVPLEVEIESGISWAKTD